MLAAATAHVDAEFVGEGSQTALQSTDDARGDSGGMPVHAHDGAKRLEPKWMRQPLQEFVAAVVMHDRLGDDGAEHRHALAKPSRHPAAVERKIYHRDVCQFCFESGPSIAPKRQEGLKTSGAQPLAILETELNLLGTVELRGGAPG